MGKKTVYWLSCIFFLLFCLYISPSVEATSVEEEVLQVETNWCKAFKKADIEFVSSLYWHSPKTTEFPPNESHIGWDDIETSLKKYLGLGIGVFDWTYFDTQVLMLTDNVAIIRGYHHMFEKPPGGDPYALIFRFMLVVQKIDGKWLIVHNAETMVDTGPERERPVLEGEPPVPEKEPAVPES